MSTTTTRNSLTKPGYADAADIAVINTDLDTIDASFAKCNWAGGAAPTVDDDFTTDGYSIGSLWYDTTGHRLYIAETVGTGSATWRMIDTAGATYTTAYQMISSLADGTKPFDVTSKTVCTNLNADMVDGIHASTIIQAGGSVNLTGTLNSTLADGTAPITVTSKTMCTNLNADMVDGSHVADLVTQALADAKGDLIVASAANTWAREAVSTTDGLSLISNSTATNGVSWLGVVDGSSRNLLINGSFDIWQHKLATVYSGSVPLNNDDTYVTDMWNLLSDGNNAVNLWTSSNGAAQRGGMLGLQTETANKKFGLIQFIENAICYPAIGTVVSLRFSAFTPSAHPNANVMAAVLSWNSTSDTVTSDVVSAWEATNTAPTLVANWTYENVPARLALVNDTWVEYKIENIAIDTANTTNIAVFIWLDDTDSTADDLLYISGVQLNIGAKCLPWSGRGYTAEMTACKRHLMIWNGDAGAYGHLGTGAANDTQYIYVEWPHSTAWWKTAAAVTMTGSWTCGATIESMAGECLTPTIVVRCSDDGKGLTANHAYVVYANNDTTARVTVSSRM